MYNTKEEREPSHTRFVLSGCCDEDIQKENAMCLEWI